MADAAGDDVKELGRFDYVIVGAGSAGCVLANRLSADPDVSVLLLEAGGQDDYIWIRIPVGYLYTINNPRTDWCFKTEAEAGLNGRSLSYPRGRVLGGCSSINGMIYMRGQARDYDGWRQLGCTGWGWDDVLPHFKAHEDYAWGGDDAHGEGGELRVEGMRISWEILDAFADAAEQAGIPRTADFNRGDNEGVGYFQVTQRRGKRWNTVDAFLRPAEERPNLTVLTRAQAQKLEMQGRRVTGVRFWHDGIDARVQADGEVVLATGSVGSPQLLQLSGIGPGALLRDRGVPVVQDNANVGENLQDHLQIRAVYSVEGVDTLNRRANSWLSKAGMAVEYALFKRGPMTMAPSQMGCFTRSDASRETPNLEYHVQPLSTDQLGDPLHPFPGITASVCNLRPESRGYVRIRDADPRTYPAIKPNYLATPGDRQVAADALKLTRRIMGQPAMQTYRPQERKPGPDVESDADLARAAGDIGTTIFHPVGTCAMGPDPATSVVDPRLSVHGIGGLRVVDASVMPRITSGNTNAPTIMIAEKAAQMILADRKAGARAAE
jgi:choline dehydrogenase-like flavoprotein